MMADEEGSHKPLSNDGLVNSLHLQTKTLFRECRGGTVSKQDEKAGVTFDLRYPRLVHVFSSNNAVWKNHNNNDGLIQTEISTPDKGSPSIRYARPQTARRGKCFRHQVGTRCYSKSRSDDIYPAFQDKISSCVNNEACSAATSSKSNEPVLSSLNLEARHENLLNSNTNQSNVFEISVLDLIDASDQLDIDAVMNDANNCNQLSTIIHLKVAAPIGTKDDDVSENSRVSPTPKRDVVARPVDLDVDSEHEKRKRKMNELSEDSSTIDSDDDDLPLIMHCKHKNRKPSRNDDYCETTMKQEVKRTYQRGSMMQHLSSAVSSQSEEMPSSERQNHRNENLYAGGNYVASRCLMDNESRGKLKSRSSAYPEVRHKQRQLLEVYERNNQALRNTSGVKEMPARNFKSPVKTVGDDVAFKKASSQKSPHRNLSIGRKNRLIRQLAQGPVCVKRAQMKQLRINPRLMSRVLRELTERNCPSNRSVVSFDCISHQNYRDSFLTYRLTKSLPAREKVTLHVPTESREECDQVGKEVLKLWQLGSDEVEELRKQVKQEMRHKRTEHIMPVLLQMSYEQIESAYEQVKKDMSTYEVTEDDSTDDEEDEEEIEDNEDGEFVSKANEEKSVKENSLEDVENTTDENLHLTSFEIIVHDETSKTISCETVNYLEWREKNPALNNGASELHPVIPNSRNPSATNLDKKISEMNKLPEAVHSTEESVKQTVYSQSRPKRHAVDYSPSAFAPIRLMEGKRLSGARETPSKHLVKKSVDKKTVTSSDCPREKRTSISTSAGPSKTSKQLAPEIICHTNANGSKVNSPSAMESRNKIREKKQPHNRLVSPESPSELVTAPVGNVSNITDECFAGSKGVDNEDCIAKTASDDDIPVILDMSEMPLSSEPDSVSFVEKFPRVHDGSDDVGSERIVSAYDVVRDEYIRLRGLTEMGSTDNVLCVDSQGSKEACSISDDATNEMDIEEVRENRNSNSPSPKKLADSLIDDTVPDSVVESSAEVFDPSGGFIGKDGLALMPRLQLQRSDSCDAEAEPLSVPPDLGLPIESSDTRQQPASPVQPPVLLVEDETANERGSNSVETSSAPIDFVHESGVQQIPVVKNDC